MAKTLRFTRLLKHLLKPGTGVPVVTTNYDRLLEIASEEAGLGVDMLFVGQFAGHLNELESRLPMTTLMSFIKDRLERLAPAFAASSVTPFFRAIASRQKTSCIMVTPTI